MKESEPIQTGQKLEDVNVSISQIELPKLDITPYIGKKARIVEVSTKKGEFGYCVLIKTEIVATIEGGKSPIEMRGTKLFGLQEDSNGNVGWGEGTKLGLYLKKMKVKTPQELKGKEVILQSMTSNKNVDWLTFN